MTVFMCIVAFLIIVFVLFIVIVVGAADAGFKSREDPEILKKWEKEKEDLEHLR